MPTPRLVLLLASGLLLAGCNDDKGLTSATLTLTQTVPFGEDGGDGNGDGGSGSVTGQPTTGGPAGTSDATVGASTGSDPTGDPSTTGSASSTGDPADPSTTNPTNDPSTTNPTNDPSTTNPTNDPTNDPSTTNPTNDPTNDTTTTDSGGDPVEAWCQSLGEPGACHDCSCESCPTSWGKCMNDAGCNAVLTCFAMSGCTIDCYDVCADVIDTYGGPDGPWYEYTENIAICQIQACKLYCG